MDHGRCLWLMYNGYASWIFNTNIKNTMGHAKRISFIDNSYASWQFDGGVENWENGLQIEVLALFFLTRPDKLAIFKRSPSPGKAATPPEQTRMSPG